MSADCLKPAHITREGTDDQLPRQQSPPVPARQAPQQLQHSPSLPHLQPLTTAIAKRITFSFPSPSSKVSVGGGGGGRVDMAVCPPRHQYAPLAPEQRAHSRERRKQVLGRYSQSLLILKFAVDYCSLGKLSESLERHLAVCEIACRKTINLT